MRQFAFIGIQCRGLIQTELKSVDGLHATVVYMPAQKTHYRVAIYKGLESDHFAKAKLSRLEISPSLGVLNLLY